MSGMQTWQGRQFEVKVLCSMPGMAQQIWIENDAGALLVDAGDGVIRDIRSNNLYFDLIKGIIITHGHFDHVGGLHSLLGFMRMVGRSAVLPICMPDGCVEAQGIVDNFTSVYRETTPYRVEIKNVLPGDTFEVAKTRVTAYPVVHCGGVAGHEVLDQIPALGYRLSYACETVAVTGDTGFCSGLEDLVRNADLALIEATFGDARGTSEEELSRVHLSEAAARRLGSLAREFILIHKGR
jgi:ribonuclease BN (tRNA processing enzyme)